MPDFNEDFLQFIWQHKLLLPLPTISTKGKNISILKPGEINYNSGPDFFNGQIKIDQLILAGNIELHLKTSDWLKHGHEKDKNYNNIILHVVYEHDIELEQNTQNQVEVLELKNLIDKSSIAQYKQLFASKQKLPCAKQINNCSDFAFLSWLDRMVIERLETKVQRLENWFKLNQGDYTQTFYLALLRNFGFKVNADAFELLGKQLPIQILLKHADNLIQLESLLLGTSGMLENQFKNPYITKLQNEFEFLKVKYKIIPLQKTIFKFSRLRPANFPNLRLAQFAALMHQASETFLSPEQNTNYQTIYKQLDVLLHNYWKNHYQLDGKSHEKDLKIGQFAIENIMINTYAPFLFFYSKKTGREELLTDALKLLQECEFEKNNITKLFASKQHLLKDGSNSQGLINLYEQFCKQKKCLKCGIASNLLNPKTNA